MNPILDQMQNRSSGMNPLQAAAMVKQLMTGKNPQAVFDQMLRTNPQFAQFVQSIKGKDINQVARENGIDLDTLKSLFE